MKSAVISTSVAEDMMLERIIPGTFTALFHDGEGSRLVVALMLVRA